MSGPPTSDELRNATYRGLTDLTGPVTLRDGRWEGEPYVAGGAARPTVTLARDFRLVGDLDDAGADEVVVVLAESGGGSGTVSDLAVVARRPGGVVNVATIALGDRVQIRSARIEGGRILVSAVRVGKQDAACCPGELVEWGWTLAGDTLQPVAVPGAAGRLSLDTLAGAEWVLRWWDVGEPAPAEPEITLAVAGGRVAGSAGCNRYFAGVKAGAQPGDIAVGPAGATRMACPERMATMEARFLQQLAGVRKFGFLLGHLALTYETGDTLGTMLFERRPSG